MPTQTQSSTVVLPLGTLCIPFLGLMELIANAVSSPVLGLTGDYFAIDLYTNYVSPSNEIDISAFDIATFEGYSQIRLSRDDLEVIENLPSQVYAQYGPAIAFSQNSKVQQTIYGFVVSSLASGNVLWYNAGQFPTVIPYLYNVQYTVALYFQNLSLLPPSS